MIGLAAALAAFFGVEGAQPVEKVLWRDPGRVELVDFTYAAGGASTAPRAPFHFEKEDFGGTSPKIVVKDVAGARWRVKGGLEVRAETFSTRFVSALGYFAETTYFVGQGKIEGAHALKRASGFVKPDGTFTYAAFERVESQRTYLPAQTWSWDTNPFTGTPQLKGLKILIMLLSNWDNKDSRDQRRGSNTGVLETRFGRRTEWLYFVNDWGQTLGSWGLFMRTRSRWDPAAFERQTPAFVSGLEGGKVRFGFTGQHSVDFKDGITPADVRWLMQYLGRLTDAQIRAALLASGATADEEVRFTRALRGRIKRLAEVSGVQAASGRLQ